MASQARVSVVAALALAFSVSWAAAQAQAQAQAPMPAQTIPYTVIHPDEPNGDGLAEPRRLAAAVVAQDAAPPREVVDIGSDTGEFLEAFLQQFPQAHGQWTEPVTIHQADATRRLARFAPRVAYVIGCPGRDISKGCVPRAVDVMITAWLQVHQGLQGVRDYYRRAYALLPSGGWVVDLDHVRSDAPKWADRMAGARKTAAAEGLLALAESPPLHRTDPVMPTLADQLAALKDAGFEDGEVVWRRLDTVLLMARKR